MGYKVHLTETCNDDTPNLVTHVETTLATIADSEVIEPIHAELDRKQCLPGQHLVDNCYGSGTAFFNSSDNYGVDLFGPARPDVSWQAKQVDAFDIFHIDFAAYRDLSVETHHQAMGRAHWESGETSDPARFESDAPPPNTDGE